MSKGTLRTILAAAAVLALVLLAVGRSPVNAGDSIVSPDTEGDVGQNTSLVLDAAGKPVVSYYDATNGDLKILHCRDASCAGGDESITSPDTEGDVGKTTSIALDDAGNPVVAYRDETNGSVNLMHCNDPDCAGGDESIIGVAAVSAFPSLVLDGGGNPVISYYLGPGVLGLVHCNDANCLGGDESYAVVDGTGNVGLWSSLQLDAAGNPVISYRDIDTGSLKIAHCNDANCVGGDESIETAFEGNADAGTDLELDADGNPVVAFYDFESGFTQVLHCDDPNCDLGGDTVNSLGVPGGLYPSVELNEQGLPVVSVSGVTVVRCNDAACAPGGDIFATFFYAGGSEYTSLALDPTGRPIVSFYDSAAGDLSVLRCDDVGCQPPPLFVWGDNDCDVDVDSVDALKGLQYVAGISFVQTTPCFPLGETIGTSPAAVDVRLWGDVDCDGDVDAVDALGILRHVAGIATVAGGGACPAVESAVGVDGFELVAGVNEVYVTDGNVGPVCATEPGWFPLVSADDDAINRSASTNEPVEPRATVFSMAREYGDGRVVTLGHEGLLFPVPIMEGDNLRFVTNVIDWLDQQGGKNVALSHGHDEIVNTFAYDPLIAALTDDGYTVTPNFDPLDSGVLDDADVLVVGNMWGTITESEVAAVEQFVANGGGLFAAALGWSFGPFNGGGIPYEDWAMLALMEPYGMVWPDDIYIEDPTDTGHNSSAVFHTFFGDPGVGSVDCP